MQRAEEGKVESGVRYVKGNFMTTVGDERDVNALNRLFARWVLEVAGCRIHGTTYRKPVEVFEATEREVLLPLTTQMWVPVSWREPSVRRDCCVLVEKARFSAPWRLVGKKLLARVNSKSVELYWEDTRVATHERQPPGGRSIKSEHPTCERESHTAELERLSPR